MASQLDRSIDLKHYLRVLWRRKSVILLAAVTVFCTALVVLQWVPKQYRSAATLSIQERDPLSRRLEEALGASNVAARSYGYEDQRRAKIVSNIHSRPFLEDVIRVLKMDEDPKLIELARREAASKGIDAEEAGIRILVQSLQARIEIRGIGPGLYQFAVRDFDPRTSQLLARWISELFIDISTKRELDRIRAQRNFSLEQLRIYEDQVARSEVALRRYRESLIGTALQNNPVNGATLRATETRVARLRSDEATARARMGVRARAAIDAGLPADDPTLREDPRVRALASDLAAAIEAVSTGLLTLTPNDPGLATLRGELSQVRSELYGELELRARELYGDRGGDDWTRMADYAFAELDARAHADAAAHLDLLLRDYKRRMRNEPGHELELTRLSNELQKNRELLDSFKSQMVASDLQQAVETTDLGLRIEIIDPAQLPLDPSWPNAKKILALAALMGPLLGIGFAFVSELMDPTLRSLDDIQRVVPEPVLGTLPLMESVLPVNGGLRRRWIPVTLAGVVLLTAAFFVTRDRLFPDLGVPKEAVQAVAPVEGVDR